MNDERPTTGDAWVDYLSSLRLEFLSELLHAGTIDEKAFITAGKVAAALISPFDLQRFLQRHGGRLSQEVWRALLEAQSEQAELQRQEEERIENSIESRFKRING